MLAHTLLFHVTMKALTRILAPGVAILLGACGGFEFDRGDPSGISPEPDPGGRTLIVNGGKGLPKEPPPSFPNDPPPNNPPPNNPPPNNPPPNNPPPNNPPPNDPPPNDPPPNNPPPNNPPPKDPTPPPGSCGNDYETQVFNLVNDERKKRGLPPYRCNPGTSKSAHDYSQTMCDTGRFSHTGPGGSSAGTRMKRAGVTGMRGWGENIAWGQGSPSSVMRSWMNSSGHRRNILGSFTHMGVGYVLCGGSRPYWTQNFATL